jgi:hypothetical protein
MRVFLGCLRVFLILNASGQPTFNCYLVGNLMRLR